jgi:peptidoglycan/LPS O-acetylase OafA/YrhL
MNRIRTLDGWRGIAIALVLFDHIQYALLGHFMQPWTQTGHHGVTIFFVLSGFLITSKLLEGPIALKRFYVRRFFRLMPVAWTYLAVLLLIGHQVHMSIAAPTAVLASLLFYRNYLLVYGGASTWHFWSLSLEEQFYLVWPCILPAADIRRCRWIAAAGAIGCAVYRFYSWGYYNREFFNCQSQVRADELLVGCLMALLLQEPRLQAAVSQWSKMWALPAFAVLVYCMAHFTLLPPLTECICIAALIASSMLHSESIFARPLTSRALSQLGIVSYSIYVWQGIFMLLARGSGATGALLLFFAMPLCAVGSYVYIERPFTRLGHRLTSRPERQPRVVEELTAP